MRLLLPFKALLLSLFRFLKEVVADDLAMRAPSTVRRIGAIERAEVKPPPGDEMEKLLVAMNCSKAEVILVSACLEALYGLDPAADPELAAAQERLIAESAGASAACCALPASRRPRNIPLPTRSRATASKPASRGSACARPGPSPG
jgi:hypothetical protein